MAGSPKGDETRAAILTALDEQLRESGLEAINIAELSRAAGVTRSAFYFYFDNKAAAVAALAQEMYADAFNTTAPLIEGVDPGRQIPVMLRGLFDTWSRHQHLYRAVLEARNTNADVQQLWDSDRESFVPVIAEMILAHRASGFAPDGPNPRSLATMLLELNDRALERLSRGLEPDIDRLVDVMSTIWLRSIFGADLSHVVRD